MSFDRPALRLRNLSTDAGSCLQPKSCLDSRPSTCNSVGMNHTRVFHAKRMINGLGAAQPGQHELSMIGFLPHAGLLQQYV